MGESPTPGRWWHSLPGLLTAVAAVLTALTGLVALLFQQGVLGTAQQAAPAGPRPEQGASAAMVRTKPWSEVQAIVVGRDGVLTPLRAESLSHCISVAHDLALEGGRAIPFQQMRSFDVLRADANDAPNAKAQLRITLLDGQTIDGTVPANCDLFGTDQVGRFTTYFHLIESVRFER